MSDDALYACAVWIEDCYLERPAKASLAAELGAGAVRANHAVAAERPEVAGEHDRFLRRLRDVLRILGPGRAGGDAPAAQLRLGESEQRDGVAGELEVGDLRADQFQ